MVRQFQNITDSDLLLISDNFRMKFNSVLIVHFYRLTVFFITRKSLVMQCFVSIEVLCTT